MNHSRVDPDMKNDLLKPAVTPIPGYSGPNLPFTTTTTNNTPSASNEGGLLKGMGTYMVTDDLVITPMSGTSRTTLLKQFNVEDGGALQEKMVTFGTDEVVKLLKCLLQSKRVLTDVFLGDGCEVKVEETNAGSLD